MYFNLELSLLNFYMYYLKLTWHGENYETRSPRKYSDTYDKGIFVSAVEISCLAHGTCIGYSSPLTLTDNVRFENSMSDSAYGNTNMYNF